MAKLNDLFEGNKKEKKRKIYGKFKYIVIKNNYEIETPIIFPESLSHDSFKNNFNIISAGFVTIDNDQVISFGESTSLRLKSRPEDSDLLSFYFFRRK